MNESNQEPAHAGWSGIANGTAETHTEEDESGEKRPAEEEPTFNPEILVSDAMAKNSRQLLYAHIYNYLIQHKYYETSRRLLDEADVPLSKSFPEERQKSGELLHAKMLMNSRDTFLCEWWQSLWTLHEYVESQPVEKISSSRLLREPVTPILPQRPPSAQGFIPANSPWMQNQHLMQGGLGYARMASNPGVPTNMGPPKGSDIKAGKAGAPPASPLRKTATSYPQTQTTPGVSHTPTAISGPAVGVPSQIGVAGGQMPPAQSALTTPLYTNLPSAARSTASSTTPQPQAPSKSMMKTFSREHQQMGPLPQGATNTPVVPDNMMLYMQQQREMMTRYQGDDDMDKANLNGAWSVNQQRLHEQYQKNMYMMQQQQQSKRAPQSRPYSRQQELSKQAILAQNAQTTQASQSGAHQPRHGVQEHKSDTTPSQQESTLHQHASPPQPPVSSYPSAGDMIPDSNASAVPTMDQQYLNMMMMQYSPTGLSPGLPQSTGGMNEISSTGQSAGPADKFRDNLSSEFFPLRPPSSQQN
ncbi:LAQU0S04e07470g1_1 [Lachancea quebecensis]|uniref:LAQU0S04e07470g1_1 n=1 Tax=Lachancea quebecensis TaxID=1654605 RepID=A0A0P1KQE3_9SACH|nr:LAQU0S04e07470g1_1 [Lachancea quebecensis]